MVLPDADDPQLPFNDPTQQRYELIRPVAVIGNRTATERAQETGIHPETVGRLKRRFEQQGMLGLLPDTVEVIPARRRRRVPDTVVQELAAAQRSLRRLSISRIGPHRLLQSGIPD